MPIVRGDVWPQAMDSMYGLEWDGQLDFLQLVGGDDPATPVANITRKYNEVRDVALNMGYDGLLTIESDMIVPGDALERLAAVDADVVYGVYIWRRGGYFWTAYSSLKEKRGKSISRDPGAARKAWGKVIETKGVGMGCTLIHRRVLEALPFKNAPAMNWCCDWALALDCQEEGFVQKHDLGVICGHIQRDLGISGMGKGYPQGPKVLWPDITKPDFYRVEEMKVEGSAR